VEDDPSWVASENLRSRSSLSRTACSESGGGGDVGNQHERRVRLPVVVQLRQQVDLDHARAAVLVPSVRS